MSVTITAADINKLRQATGAGMLDCRKALTESNGDFEAAIEGAGHMGDKEIANYLLDAGSRVTLFVLCMLGKTDLVKPILEQYPKLVFAIGPHGFTMLHHAKMGGKEGEDLANYLQEKGLKETWVKIK